MRRTILSAIQSVTVVLAACLAVPALVAPASAQFFDRIFRDEPPRPPGDVRGAPPPDQPVQRPPADAQRPTYQTLRPPAARGAPSEWQNPDLLPQNQQPGQQPPQGQQFPGDVQSQPLAPPPGTVAPQGQDPLRGSQDAGLPPAQNQPGLGQPGLGQPGLGQPGQMQPGQVQPQPGQLPGEDAQQNDEIVVRPPEQKIENPKAVFTGLDKITGRTITFDVAINETVQFGALQVTPRVCYTRPPTEAPNTDAFVKVDEVTLQGDVKQIFSGWMFAASPGLNAVEHPIYDVWLIDCKGGGAATASAETDGAKDKKADGSKTQAAPVPVPPRQPQRRTSAPPQQPGFMPALR